MCAEVLRWGLLVSESAWNLHIIFVVIFTYLIISTTSVSWLRELFDENERDDWKNYIINHIRIVYLLRQQQSLALIYLLLLLWILHYMCFRWCAIVMREDNSYIPNHFLLNYTFNKSLSVSLWVSACVRACVRTCVFVRVCCCVCLSAYIHEHILHIWLFCIVYKVTPSMWWNV